MDQEPRTAVGQLIGELRGREPEVHGERDGSNAGRSEKDLQASRAILQEERDTIPPLNSHLSECARGGRDPRVKILPR